MMAISFALFLVVGLYLDNVLPSAFGLRKPWYFLFQPSYWCGNRMRRTKAKISCSDDESVDMSFKYEFETKYIKKENFESPAPDLVR